MAALRKVKNLGIVGGMSSSPHVHSCRLLQIKSQGLLSHMRKCFIKNNATG
jgi:hypothetical protein